MSEVVTKELNPIMLPSIPLEQRRGLPSCSGIYFAISADNEVLYIGRSVNLAQRWVSHHRHPELEEIGQVRIAWLEVNEPKLLPAIEEALIDWFAPSLNNLSVMTGASVVVQGTAVRVLLKQIRKSKGLSQNDLARLIHMSPQNIQKIEQGDAKSLTFVTLGRLCKALGCQPGDLLIYEDDSDGNDNSDISVEAMAAGEPRHYGQADETKLRKRTRSFITVIPKVPESA